MASEPKDSAAKDPDRAIGSLRETWSECQQGQSALGWAMFGNDTRQVIAFGAGRHAFMSARSMVKPDTNAGKPSLTPLH
jgi:hypothetical protein